MGLHHQWRWERVGNGPMPMTAGKIIRRAMLEHWPMYTFGIAAVLLTSITEVLVPKFIQWSVDVLGVKGAMGVPAVLRGPSAPATLRVLAEALLVLLIFGLLGRFGWRQLLARRTHYAGRDLKVRFWAALRDLPVQQLQRYPLGDLMNRATGDWNASRTIHGFTMVLTLDLMFFTGLSLALMLSISPELTLYSLIAMLFMPRFILRLAHREHDQHLVAQEQLGQLSAAVAQSLSTIRTQRATSSDEVWQRRLRDAARSYADRRYDVVKTSWKIFPLGAVPTLVAYAVLLLLGMKRIEAGVLSVGEFIALQSYVLMLQGPLFDLGDTIAEWQRGLASLSRLLEIYELEAHAEPERARQGFPELPLAPGVPMVAARDLEFRYADGAGKVLAGVDLEVAGGETVGILGPIGAGKSTLLNLVAGILPPGSGSLRLAGMKVEAVARAWLSANVAMVPQQSFLFAGTIRSNLNLDLTFADHDLWRVLTLVRMDADVRAFAAGLDTRVGEWGINLSGGQKQRLALARAMLRPRALLLMDDCLSAVDTVTEAAILLGLREELRGATVIWVAHRKSTLRLCDRIYHLHGGHLVEDNSGQGEALPVKTTWRAQPSGVPMGGE